MPSDAARERAIKRGPGFWGFLLAHHGPEELDRCYRFFVGSRPVWICARCAGLYPALAATLIVLLAIRVPRGSWDWLWLFVLPVPAVWNWAGARLGRSAGTNLGRTATGALLGFSLGRTAELNMRDPANVWVMGQLGALAAVVVLVEAWWYLRRRRRDLE